MNECLVVVRHQQQQQITERTIGTTDFRWGSSFRLSSSLRWQGVLLGRRLPVGP